MPPAAEDLDDEGFPRITRSRYDDAPPRPWWRPASTVGRVLLGIAALAIVGAFTTGVLLLRNLLDHDSRFRIEGSSNIQATGLTEVSRAQMLPVFGEDIGRNIFFVPLAERRKQLEEIPWVERATVMRVLPDQIHVSIVERKPVAFVRTGEQIGLVDANGVLLSMPALMMAQHRYSFPVLTGIDARDPLAGRRARMAVYERLLGELDSNGQHLSEQISEIDLTDPEDARVLMPEPGKDILAHFGQERFLERYQRYKAHIGEWRQQYPALASVDLRYDQQVVLKMGAGAATKTADGKTSSSVVEGVNGAAGSDLSAPALDPNATTTSKPSPAKTDSATTTRSAAKKKTAPPKKKHPEPKRTAQTKPKPHTAAGQGN